MSESVSMCACMFTCMRMQIYICGGVRSNHMYVTVTIIRGLLACLLADLLRVVLCLFPVLLDHIRSNRLACK